MASECHTPSAPQQRHEHLPDRRRIVRLEIRPIYDIELGGRAIDLGRDAGEHCAKLDIPKLAYNDLAQHRAEIGCNCQILALIQVFRFKTLPGAVDISTV